ncbi:hypothetical protein ABLO01_09125 [Mycobacterium tuberculosis]
MAWRRGNDSGQWLRHAACRSGNGGNGGPMACALASHGNDAHCV